MVRLALTVLLALASVDVSAMPSWATQNSLRVEGKLLRISCSGTGPTAGIARKEALNDCWTSAAHMLSSDISVKSLSASSERQVIYQQEVVNRSRIKGLGCTPRRETIERSGEELTVWLLCEFDLTKAKPIHPIHDADAELPIATESVQNSVDSDDKVVVTLATVPKCDDVIVMGRGPARILPCHRNPMPVLIAPDDSEIRVRAKDHFPKSVFLGPRREARGYVQVVLQSNH